jgi:hypothetical protein
VAVTHRNDMKLWIGASIAFGVWFWAGAGVG